MPVLARCWRSRPLVNVLVVLGADDPEASFKDLPEWEVTIVRGAAAGRDILANADFAVVISAIEAGGDGVLAELRLDRNPTVRVLIVKDECFDCVEIAHHVLQAPVDSATLEMTLDLAAGGAGTIGAERLATLLGAKAPLPRLPASFTKLLTALDDETSQMRAIVKILEGDPGLAAATLKVANSAYFGFRQKVTTLTQAARILGLNGIRSAALGGQVFSMFAIDEGTLSDLQQDSLLSLQIVRKIAGAHAEPAATAALLHDVGQLMMHAHVPNYRRLVTRARLLRKHLHEAEIETLGITHVQLGAALLAEWNLPNSVVQALGFSHTALPLPARGLDDRAVSYLTASLMLELKAEREMPELFPLPWLERLGIQNEMTEWRDYAGEICMLWPAA